MSDEHISLDGTPLQAWASQMSFPPKESPPDFMGGGPRNAAPDLKGQRSRNDTYASTSDADKTYDTGNFVACRQAGMTPHVAQ